MLFLGYRHWSLRWALKIVAQNCVFDRIHWRGSDTGKNIGWLSTSNGQACGSPRPQSLFVLCPTSSPGRQDSGCRIPHHFLPSLPQSDGFKYRNLTWATSQWINGQVYYYIPKRILNRPHISSYIHISGASKPPYRHFPAPLRSTRPHGGRPGSDGGRLAADRGGGGQVWKQAGRGDWGAEQSADMMMCFKEVAFGNQRWLRNPH